MGFYRRHIFPRLLELVGKSESINSKRHTLLSKITSADLVEIGFGSGLNLPYYPTCVTTIAAVEVNQAMRKWADRRIQASSITVQFHSINGEQLPFADQSYCAVVSTLTLCSIDNPMQALTEIYRVLRPAGALFFLEHGLSPDISVANLQRRLNPIQKRLGDGCRLDRDIPALIRNSGFAIETMESEYLEKIPKFSGYSYLGVARKPS